MNLVEFVEAEIYFYPTENGGRKTALKVESLKYMPHFRVTENSELLGVRFVGGPKEIHPGESTKVQVYFMYPEVNYSALTIGGEFYLCEGPFPIGKGKVMRRWTENIEQNIVFRPIE